jgi:UDP-N-acetylglucosamine/UDP-N-acetylgalactosamine 4-epimerase
MIDLSPHTGSVWLVTGAAGFIGSNLVEYLLRAGQTVRAIDNFATGHQRNFESVRELVGDDAWARFSLIEGDIRNRENVAQAMVGVSHVLHQAGLGSVPRSLVNPIATNEVNVSGFLNVMEEARTAGVKSFVYAASSSTYGDEPALPKIEERIGRPLSPYAVTKLVNELYAEVYLRCYGFRATGLRYFNVFGPRQDPDGAYAAVIPKWTAAMIDNQDVVINGDGETSRDFCFVANAVEANIRASLAPIESQGAVYNVAVGGRTTLNQLFNMLKMELAQHQITYKKEPVYKDFRAGDVRHSQADISKARRMIGYDPAYNVAGGITVAMPWYVDYYRSQKKLV